MMQASVGPGAEPPEAMAYRIDVPSLDENATIRDIAAYMKAFKASVVDLTPETKHRAATSIQKALCNNDITTDTLNQLLSDPTIHRTFNQTETRARAMSNPISQAGHAGMTAEDQDIPKPVEQVVSNEGNKPKPVEQATSMTAGKYLPAQAAVTPTTQFAATPTPQPQMMHQAPPPITAEEWNVLKNVPDQQRATVLAALRQTPPHQLTDAGYHAYHRQQYGMHGYSYPPPMAHDPNMDPALYGPYSSPRPSSGYMHHQGMYGPAYPYGYPTHHGAPYQYPPPMSPQHGAPVTPHGPPMGPPMGPPGTPSTPATPQSAPMTPQSSSVPPKRSADSAEVTPSGRASKKAKKSRKHDSPAKPRVEPFAQPRPAFMGGVPQIVHAAPAQHGPAANPSVASTPGRAKKTKAQTVLQPTAQSFVPAVATSGAQAKQSSPLQPTAQPFVPSMVTEGTQGKQSSPLQPTARSFVPSTGMQVAPLIASPVAPNTAHYRGPQAGTFSANANTPYQPLYGVQNATAAHVHVQGNITAANIFSTPKSVVEVDVPGAPSVVEAIGSSDNEENVVKEKQDAPAVVDEHKKDNVNQKEKSNKKVTFSEEVTFFEEEKEKVNEKVAATPDDGKDHIEDDRASLGSWTSNGIEELFPDYIRRYETSHTKDEMFQAISQESVPYTEANTSDFEVMPGTIASQITASGTNNTEGENNAHFEKFPAVTDIDRDIFEDFNDKTSEENLDISSFDADIFDELFNENGDFVPDEIAESTINKAVVENAAKKAAQKAAEYETEMARLRAFHGKATKNKKAESSTTCDVPEAENTNTAPAEQENILPNLVSDQATPVTETLVAEQTNENAGNSVVIEENAGNNVEVNEKATEINKPCDCGRCGRSGLQASCCLENLQSQHPDAWSFLQPMIRHNCIVTDRTKAVEEMDLGQAVVALYPHLIGQRAEVRFGDPVGTRLQAPILQLPEHLRFIPSITIFEDGSAFANDPVGMQEYQYTGKVITDGPNGVDDRELMKYRSYWGETPARAYIGRLEAEAKKLISAHDENNPDHASWRLGKRSLVAVDHQPGQEHTCGAGTNEYLVYNPHLLPKKLMDEHMDLYKALENAKSINFLQKDITADFLAYIPRDLKDSEARASIPFPIVVRLAHIPQIFDLVPDATKLRIYRGVRGTEYLPFASKIVTLVALEMRRQRERFDSEILSTLRRLVPHFQEFNHTKDHLAAWRMQFLTNEEYLEFFWIVRCVIRFDFRGPKLLRMVAENDARLFDTQRDDDMDVLGLTLTLEEMLRITGKAIEEETAQGKKRRAEDDDGEPSAKRAKV